MHPFLNGMKINILASIVFLFAFLGQLSAKDPIDVAIHSSGKIYLVVGTLVVIFLGIVFYLFYIDKQITNIENQIKDNE